MLSSCAATAPTVASAVSCSSTLSSLWQTTAIPSLRAFMASWSQQQAAQTPCRTLLLQALLAVDPSPAQQLLVTAVQAAHGTPQQCSWALLYPSAGATAACQCCFQTAPSHQQSPLCSVALKQHSTPQACACPPAVAASAAWQALSAPTAALALAQALATARAAS